MNGPNPPWPSSPVIVEVNAWTMLSRLGSAVPQPITLAGVPGSEWDRLARPRTDAVWLMGVWTRSPAGRRIALAHPDLQHEYDRALPDVTPEDVVGSPYSIHAYVPDARFGGRAGLAAARGELARRGLKLIVDFVPNHVAIDHPWTEHFPDCFIREGNLCARGRDPYFPPWTDTAQLNAFSPAWRQRAVETLLDIAKQADGVRCDMAMLALSSIFSRTWGDRAGEVPETEFWREVIDEVRIRHPDFLFIAEAYWEMEWELLSLGFDYCYDKRLYDRLANGDAWGVREHLRADLPYQQRLLRFLENHDEPRAAARLSPAQNRAALLALATLPGAKLLFDCQTEGHRVKLPVQLGRQPDEDDDTALARFCRRLFDLAFTTPFREGTWALCDTHGWPDNSSHRSLLAWTWSHGDQCAIVVINYSAEASQGRVRLPKTLLTGKKLLITDALAGNRFERDMAEVGAQGLFVDLRPWAFHVLLWTCPPLEPLRT